MSRLDTAWIDPCSVFALGRDHFLGRKERGTTDTANTFSTSGYLIISVATRSLMTPITYLAHRSGTYCVKSNVLPDNLTQKGHRKERDARRWSSTTITGTAAMYTVLSQKFYFSNTLLYFGHWKQLKSGITNVIFPSLHSALL